jgi:hypothetical protein
MQRLTSGDEVIFRQRLEPVDSRPVREDRLVVLDTQAETEAERRKS